MGGSEGVVGDLVGDFVGLEVVDCVGFGVGDSVGAFVGPSVAEIVGDLVGDAGNGDALVGNSVCGERVGDSVLPPIVGDGDGSS